MVKVRIRAGVVLDAPQPFIDVAAEPHAPVRCTTREVTWTWTDTRNSSCISGICQASAKLSSAGQTLICLLRGAVTLQNETVRTALLSRVALPALLPHRQGCLPDTAAHLLQSLSPPQHAPLPRQHRKGMLQCQRRPEFPSTRQVEGWRRYVITAVQCLYLPASGLLNYCWFASLNSHACLQHWIVFQLLHAVAQSHEQGICHGDIKCENILVTSWHWLFLADFASYKPAYLPADNPVRSPSSAGNACAAADCCGKPVRWFHASQIYPSYARRRNVSAGYSSVVAATALC